VDVPLKTATTADFVYENESVTLFLQPGDDLEARFTADKMLKSLKFKGKGANENNFLLDYNVKFIENQEYQVLPDNINLNESSFIEFLDYRKADALNYFAHYTARNPVSEEFKNYILAEIEYSWANDRLMFNEMRMQVKGYPIKLSAGYYRFLDKIKLNHPQGIRSHAYLGFLQNYVKYLATTTQHRPQDMDYYEYSYNVAKEKLSGEPRNILLANILYESMRKGFIQYTSRMLQDFESLNTDKDINDFLAVTYNTNKAFALGSPAPAFTLKSVEGKHVSLHDFKGKLVYLNFWNSKCGLCQLDLPYALELEKELASEDVVFVNIGMDENEGYWRESVTRRKLKGVQLYGGHMEQILKDYKVVDLPSYYLIDTDGTFISTKAKRPSNAGAKEQIIHAMHK
jgi:thiol-disulfide isomerase/thioredoxin